MDHGSSVIHTQIKSTCCNHKLLKGKFVAPTESQVCLFLLCYRLLSIKSLLFVTPPLITYPELHNLKKQKAPGREDQLQRNSEHPAVELGRRELDGCIIEIEF